MADEVQVGTLTAPPDEITDPTELAALEIVYDESSLGTEGDPVPDIVGYNRVEHYVRVNKRDDADALVQEGGIQVTQRYFAGYTEIVAPPVVDSPPVQVDAPFVGGTPAVGQVLNCTMGNWTNEPTTYDYAWKRDNIIDVGTNANTYTVEVLDVGYDIICIVTATNAFGSTVSDPSNPVHATN